MKVISPSVKIMNPIPYEKLLGNVEAAGRVCYKSEDKITFGSAEKFIRGIINRGHEAVLEHGMITVKFVCDRGVTHEIVRHRMASYCQESTRYCNYSKDKFGKEITVIKPCFWSTESYEYQEWYSAMVMAEQAYFHLLQLGNMPEEARSVLPNSLKTELVTTANIREWRHFLKLRCSERAHPQMREIANMLKEILKTEYPVFFEDL